MNLSKDPHGEQYAQDQGRQSNAERQLRWEFQVTIYQRREAPQVMHTVSTRTNMLSRNAFDGLYSVLVVLSASSFTVHDK
ncbi:hypothetical protein PM082_024195 [Marasmius tenuissimus]|nr:hypothetical protein PM082_024195 [Marasmius tenuissimus]